MLAFLVFMCLAFFILGHIMTSPENSSDEEEENESGNMVTFENAVSFLYHNSSCISRRIMSSLQFHFFKAID